MIELFLQMPTYLQIFCCMAMLVGLAVMWRFKGIVSVIAIGAVGVYMSIKKKDK